LSLPRNSDQHFIAIGVLFHQVLAGSQLRAKDGQYAVEPGVSEDKMYLPLRVPLAESGADGRDANNGLGREYDAFRIF